MMNLQVINCFIYSSEKRRAGLRFAFNDKEILFLSRKIKTLPDGIPVAK